MKHSFNKLSAFIVMLMCVSATVQADIVHHTPCQPTLSQRGFTRECWENTETGKIYSDAACTQELTAENLAKAVVYAKLPSNPVTGRSEFDVVRSDNTETWEVNLNWAAETTFSNAFSGWSSTPRYAEFTVSGNDVADARLVWMKNQGAVGQGRYSVKIFVNNEEIFTKTQGESEAFEGVTVQSLSGLKNGDVVKFEVCQIAKASYNTANPTFKASLEYTGTFEDGNIIIHHTVCEPTLKTRGFTIECWEDPETGKIYSDADCTRELVDEALAKAVVYAKLPESPVVGLSSFTLSEHENDWGVDFNWAAVTTFLKAAWGHLSPRFAQFTTIGENISNARLVWNRSLKSVTNGRYKVLIYVNDNLIFSRNQDNGEEFEGVFVLPLPELKKGDIVKFQVSQYDDATTMNDPTFKACLEFNYNNIIHHTPCQPTNNGIGFAQECWEDKDTGKFYSDEACTNELVDEELAKTVIYAKLPESQISSMNNFIAVETATYNDYTFNWAASAELGKHTLQEDYNSSASFTVNCSSPAYTRLVWSLDNKMTWTSASIAVNGEHVHDYEGDMESGIYVEALYGLKKDDVVTISFRRDGMFLISNATRILATLEYVNDCQHEYPDGSAICGKCGYVREHDHSYVNHECSLCGAAEEGFMTGYVGADADRKNIMWVLNKNARVLTFIGSGEMEEFNAEHNAWINDYKSVVTQVVIGEGITSIGDGGTFSSYNYFGYMRNLTAVTLPSTLRIIGSYAFENSYSLSSVTLPEGLQSIRTEAFYYNALQEIVIPASVSEIGYCAFTNNGSLKSVTLNGAPSIIDYHAFANCGQLQDFYLMSDSPVTPDDNSFHATPVGDATLHVNGKVFSWTKNNSVWGRFGKIVPLNNIEYTDAEGVEHEMNFDTKASDNAFTLTDGAYKNLAIYEDIPMQQQTYTRTFSAANQWQALYVPFEMQYSDWSDKFDVAAISNFHEYTNENGETEKVELEVRYVKSGKLRANIPYLIRAKAAGEQTIVLNDVTLKATEAKSIDCRSTEREYTFTGTYDAISQLQTKDYIFISGGKLCKANNDTDVLKPMRWYLTIENRESMTSDPAPLFAKPMNIRLIGEDDATGIEEVTVVSSPIGTAASGIYSLTGSKLAKPRQGINIINGNKVLVK